MTPESVGLDASETAGSDALLQQFVADKKIAGAVAAVARKGRSRTWRASACRTSTPQTPMSDRSVFRIYSMTRAITAVAAMMLHEEGKFRLDDPIAKYLPEFRDVMVVAPEGRRRPQREITVEDLLLHTSGINDRQSELYRREKVRSRARTAAAVDGQHRARRADGRSRHAPSLRREHERGSAASSRCGPARRSTRFSTSGFSSR